MEAARSLNLPSNRDILHDIARFFARSIERVRAVPGVESAALVRAVPFSGNGGDTAFTVTPRPANSRASDLVSPISPALALT